MGASGGVRVKMIYNLRDFLKEIENQFNEIEKRLNRLECPHEQTRFMDSEWFMCQEREVCVDCGKVLRRFSTRRDFLQAKLADAEAKCADDVATIKRELEELED